MTRSYDFTVSADHVYLDLQTATDEELAKAIEYIKAEQQSRISTKLVLDQTEISLKKGKSQKLTA